ncbi:FAD-binding protein [Lonepinella sp. MS14437]|uniref:FAD-binding oxidoreductase n=1 Tax=Lonepinella sp. MS14437 TaxID=3003620 RepID=UPI0036D9C127
MISEKLSSWGNLSANLHDIEYIFSQKQAINTIPHAPKKGLVFGNGRSYGDVPLNSNGLIWNMSGLSRFISFDPEQAILHCEAGITLQEIHRVFNPLGWMLPVTPGTLIPTVGGAIANDVHGKGHHSSGSFGDHLLYIKLLRTDGEIIECSRQHNADWFYATIGGIGLTGVILEAKLTMRKITSTWIDAETIPFYHLDNFFTLSDSSEQAWEYSVSWIDCFSGKNSRGLFMRGNLSQETKPTPSPKERSFPIMPPVSLVNGISLPLFNFAYFNINRLKPRKQLVDFEPFFYPLDAIHDWNRMYGPKGFFQYQSVIPKEVGKVATDEMLKVIKKSGEGSFLGVLKTFGHSESGGLLSFPMKDGVTLALDFPNKGESTLRLFNLLDRIVEEARGRLYLAKDTRMPKSLFEKGYPRIAEFLRFHDKGISSDLSRRLLGV